jgi:hypothetical protein
VCVALMSDVEQQPIMAEVEHVVQRQGEIDAETS